MRVCFLLIFLISFFSLKSQINIPTNIFDKIEVGYTTRWDIEQILGKGEYLTNKIFDPAYEKYQGIKGYHHCNGLYYEKLGIIFICNHDDELVSDVQFKSPFKGYFGLKKQFIIGETKICDIFPDLNDLNFSSCTASNYYGFTLGIYTFYIEKKEEYKDKDINTIPKFNDELDYYRNEPISIVSMILQKDNLYDDYHFCVEEGSYDRPLYAPKTERHLNYTKLEWPVFWFFIPFYALTGGTKSGKTKDDYWKEYWPNHKIANEGEYDNGYKVGLFKYYDKNGKLTQTSYYFYTKKRLWILIFGIGLLFYIIILIRKKKNRSNNVKNY